MYPAASPEELLPHAGGGACLEPLDGGTGGSWCVLAWVGDVLCLHVFAIGSCSSFTHHSPLRASLLCRLQRVTAGGAVHTNTRARSLVQTGHSTALLCKTLLLHCDCPSPFPCFHLPEMSQHHPDHHHAKPMRAGLRPCCSFLWSVSRLLFAAMGW